MIPNNIRWSSKCTTIHKKTPLRIIDQNKVLTFSGLECILENIEIGRSYNDSNIEISNCVFMRSSTFTGYGGVISVNEKELTMSISYSMFFNCSSSSHGGAIFFNASSSSMKMICACNCSSKWGHFGYFINSISNNCEYMSLLSCSYQKSGYGALSSHFGEYMFNYNNLSLNKADQVSGILANTISPFNSTFCTFSNNDAKTGICLYFNNFFESLCYANIIQNNSPGLGVVSSAGGFPHLLYCVFDMNQKILFDVITGSLEVLHCFISHDFDFSTKPHVTTSNNNSFTSMQTYRIEYMKSYFCNADNPVFVPSNGNSNDPKGTTDSSTSTIIIIIGVLLIIGGLGYMIYGLLIFRKKDSSSSEKPTQQA